MLGGLSLQRTRHHSRGNLTRARAETTAGRSLPPTGDRTGERQHRNISQQTQPWFVQPLPSGGSLAFTTFLPRLCLLLPLLPVVRQPPRLRLLCDTTTPVTTNSSPPTSLHPVLAQQGEPWLASSKLSCINLLSHHLSDSQDSNYNSKTFSPTVVRIHSPTSKTRE